eukprot:7909473-Lingulodinium_polyedra.AAC.1
MLNRRTGKATQLRATQSIEFCIPVYEVPNKWFIDSNWCADEAVFVKAQTSSKELIKAMFMGEQDRMMMMITTMRCTI